MEAAINSHGPSRKAKPFTTTLHVPRHSDEGATVPVWSQPSRARV
jgi:hypothetical protein